MEDKDFQCEQCGDEGEWGLYYNDDGELLCPDCLFEQSLEEDV